MNDDFLNETKLNRFLIVILLLFAVTLPIVEYDNETSNYTVHQTDRYALELSEKCPVCTTCMIFDE